MPRIDNITMPPCTLIPVLVYDDVIAASRWLCDVFGFTERWRVGDHRAQLAFGGGTVAITEPRTSAAVPAVQSIMVRVADVDAHYAHTRARGVTVVEELRTYPYGERQYTVEDLGGHHWCFSGSVADVAPETWGGASGPALHRPPEGTLEPAGGPRGASDRNPWITAMLIVGDAEQAVAWYREALGATELWNLGGVAGLEVAGAPFFLHESNPANPREDSPDRVGATSTRIEVFVDDPDGFVARAAGAGATGSDPVRDHEVPWGTHRQGGFIDPFGHRWSVGDRSPLHRWSADEGAAADPDVTRPRETG